MLAIAGSLLAIGSMQAQNSTPPATSSTRDSLQSLNKNAIAYITPGQGKAAGKGGFWGYAFGDFAYMGKGDSAGRGTKQQYKGLGQQGQNTNPNALEFRRVYLGYDYNINSKFSAYALMAYEGDQDVNDNRTVYLKYIYFKWKNIFKGSELRVGNQATQSFAADYNTEPLMEYRSVEKTILDMHGIDGSADMGITLQGHLWTAKPTDVNIAPTFIGYSIMMGDNSGNNPVPGFTNAISTSLGGASTSSISSSVPTISQKTGKDTTINVTTTTKQTLNPFNQTDDNAKKFRSLLFVNMLDNALTIGTYNDYINYGNYYYGTSKGYQKAVMTNKVYAVYNAKWFGLGFEWFQQNMTNGEIETTFDSKTQTTYDTTNAVQTGISIFAHGTIIQNTLNIFARYDMYTADNNYSYTYNAASTLTNHATETFQTAFTNLGGGITSFTATPTYKESYMNVGLDWTPTKDKKVHIMPNVWYYAIKNAYGSDQLASSNYMFYRISFLFAFN